MKIIVGLLLVIATFASIRLALGTRGHEGDLSWLLVAILLAFLAWMIVRKPTPARKSSVAEAPAPFFRGYVKFIGYNLSEAAYMVRDGDCTITVRNDVHIRLIEVQHEVFPEFFEIIAPMVAVTVVGGIVPEAYIQMLHPTVYLELRKKHHGV